MVGSAPPVEEKGPQLPHGAKPCSGQIHTVAVETRCMTDRIAERNQTCEEFHARAVKVRRRALRRAIETYSQFLSMLSQDDRDTLPATLYTTLDHLLRIEQHYLHHTREVQ